MAEFNLADLPVTPLNEDGSINCRNCGKHIVFLPATFPANELPDGAPRSVNHTGCPKAVPGESPAMTQDNESGHHHETINRLDQAEVEAFYKAQQATT